VSVNDGACVGGRHCRDGESASDVIGGVSCGCAAHVYLNRHVSAKVIAPWILGVSGCGAAW
jgi:hypothetical protein